MSRFPDLPKRMRSLPLDARGFPVPRFVEWVDGRPDFRIISTQHMDACVKHRRCWICGEPLGRWLVFVTGPMCCINRISPEPPSHYECAAFAARACPFLSQPLAKRGQLPDGARPAPGEMILRNPGVAGLWVTASYSLMRQGHGYLFQLGDPERVEFYAHGRRAKPDEIAASVSGGLPLLADAARRDGVEAERELARQVATFNELIRPTMEGRA